MIVQPAQRLKNIGEYYFSKKLDEVRKLNAQGKDIVNLGIGSPDLVPSRPTIDATVAALNERTTHGYAPYRCSPELRKALASWYLKTYGVQLDPETEILPLLGSKEAILYTTLAFVNPGDKVLIPDPGYPAYSSVTRLVGAEIDTYELKSQNQWMPDFDELRKKDLRNCKLMWVNYPHMPTGQRASRKLFADLVSFARDKGFMIAHDNPYSLVLNDDEPLSIFATDRKKEVCLELNSFSKAFNMAGWRVGMLAAQKDVVDTVLQVKSNADSGMFAAVQRGAIAAVENTQDWHDERNAVYRKRREIVFSIFDALGFMYDENQIGLFVWARAPENIHDVPKFLDRVLYEAGVFLTPGIVFGQQGLRYARSSLCAEEPTLNKALARIKKWTGS